MVGVLAAEFPLIIAAAAMHKGAPAPSIAAAAAAANPDAEIIIADSVADARAIALARAGPDGVIYAAGGLFLAAEARALHLGRDPAGLAFF
jgi:dihydrofolate synthase/folylpolyglutamate synthase